MTVYTSVGEKPVWLGKPQPFLVKPENGPAKIKKKLAWPITAAPGRLLHLRSYAQLRLRLHDITPYILLRLIAP